MALCITACGSAQTQTSDPAPQNPVQEETVEAREPVDDITAGEPVLNDEVMPGEELLCLCDTEEEAKKIADMYGIELVQFSYGVATFHAENPRDVIALGQEKGYPALELNGMMHIYD